MNDVICEHEQPLMTKKQYAGEPSLQAVNVCPCAKVSDAFWLGGRIVERTQTAFLQAIPSSLDLVLCLPF